MAVGATVPRCSVAAPLTSPLLSGAPDTSRSHYVASLPAISELGRAQSSAVVDHFDDDEFYTSRAYMFEVLGADLYKVF